MLVCSHIKYQTMAVTKLGIKTRKRDSDLVRCSVTCPQQAAACIGCHRSSSTGSTATCWFSRYSAT